MNTGFHGRSAASATWRLRVTSSEGRTPFMTSHSHSPSRRDAISSRCRPGHAGRGASCSVLAAAGTSAGAAVGAAAGACVRGDLALCA
jgi:hypothetical protein